MTSSGAGYLGAAIGPRRMANRYKSGWIDWAKKDQKIIRLAEGGMSIRDIAKKVQINRSTISNRLLELTKTGRLVRQQRATARAYSPEQIATILAEYELDDCDTRELASRLGIAVEDVTRVAKARGLRRSAIATEAQRERAVLERQKAKQDLPPQEAKPRNKPPKPVLVPKEIRSRFGVLARLPLTGGIEYYDAENRKTTRIGDPTDAEMDRCMRWMAAQNVGQQITMEVV